MFIAVSSELMFSLPCKQGVMDSMFGGPKSSVEEVFNFKKMFLNV